MTTKEEILALAGEPVAYLRFWAARYYAGHYEIEYEEGFEVTTRMEPGVDGRPAFPVFTADQIISAVKPLEEENQRLRMALADTEALEMGTSERCDELRQQLAAAKFATKHGPS